MKLVIFKLMDYIEIFFETLEMDLFVKFYEELGHSIIIERFGRKL